MLRVRILKDVGVGVAGAAALAGLGTETMGCAVAPVGNAAGETTSTSAERLTATTGTLSVDGWEFTYAAATGGDELIRTGDTLVATVPFGFAYNRLIDQDPTSEARIHEDPAKVAATLVVSFKDGSGAEISRVEVPTTWKTTDGRTVGTTATFTIPAASPSMDVSFAFAEIGGPARVTTNLQHTRFAIFGAFLPNKLALFDNDDAGKARTRIVEGGALVAGHEVTLSYTDWRADRFVDKNSLDLNIGQARNYNRFGPFIVPIDGDLVYEISAAYSTDGGRTWQDGGRLDARKDAPVLSNPLSWNRTAYEKTLRLPEGAQDLRVAFHVRAILVADPHYREVTTWRDGVHLNDRIVLKDSWDNAGGENFVLPVATH